MSLRDVVVDDEYTGSDRCLPCTAVNVAVAVALAAAVAVVSPPVAAVVLAASLVVIWLRGYLVPYTPAFAPRLVAAVPGARSLFGHSTGPTDAVDPADGTAGGLASGDDTGESLGAPVLADLQEAGVLRGEDDLTLAPAFRAAWRAEMDDLRGVDLVAAVQDASPAVGHAHGHEADGRRWVVVSDAERSVASERWLSRAVAIADVAAVRALTDRGLDRETAVAAAGPLRLFLSTCPNCGGAVVETTADSCCGGYGPTGPDAVLVCEDCDQRVATLPE